MSFSSELKKELALVPPEKPCCALSELCGLFASMGSLSLLGRGRVNVQFTSESLAVCRRAYTLLSQTLHIAPQIHYVTHARFGGTRRCVLTLGPVGSPPLLSALHMMQTDADGAPVLRAATPRLPITRGCCARAFLRGMMLGAGTMTNPSQGYHLELRYTDADVRQTMAKCLQRLGLPIRDGARREQRFLYLKQSDQIVTLLTALGAHQTVMRIEDLRVQKQVLGSVNRAMNCDSANLQKQLAAAHKQVEAIRQMEARDQLSALPDSLREMARMRLNRPDLTMQELGQRMEPPLGKSGVNHRMRRLLSYSTPTDHEEETPDA